MLSIIVIADSIADPQSHNRDNNAILRFAQNDMKPSVGCRGYAAPLPNGGRGIKGEGEEICSSPFT